jgi:uncharacterized protein (TIGR03435 family)
MRTAMTAAGCFFLGVGFILAQVADANLSFEVASVRPAAPQTGGREMTMITGGPGSPNPGQAAAANITLKNLLIAAYAVEQSQITGPAWLETEHYDIIAKVPPNATKEQFNRMLQNLLAERFHLALHHESKQFDGYGLVVGKNGPKPKQSERNTNASAAPAPGGPPKFDRSGFPLLDGPGLNRVLRMDNGVPHSRMAAKAQPLSALAQMLWNELGVPVLDQTGLTGEYDFTLAFAPQLFRNGVALPGDPDEADIFSAVQEQLGLKLDSKKVPLDVLVIDRADKAPTEN